jgi:hypothetical protein
MNDEKECYMEFKHYGKVIRISNLDPGMSMGEFVDECRHLAYAIGFHHTTVEEYFESE